MNEMKVDGVVKVVSSCEVFAADMQKRVDLEKSVTDLKITLEREKDAVQTLAKENTNLAAMRERELAAHRKLECDIAKIRAAIGERQLKEILG